jgi:hypothetical protein
MILLFGMVTAIPAAIGAAAGLLGAAKGLAGALEQRRQTFEKSDAELAEMLHRGWVRAEMGKPHPKLREELLEMLPDPTGQLKVISGIDDEPLLVDLSEYWLLRELVEGGGMTTRVIELLRLVRERQGGRGA